MDVSRACKQLLVLEPFYGLFLLNINKVITTHVETLAVGLSGINTCLYINMEFWNSLTDLQQISVIKHELMHICMGHLTMQSEFSDKKIMNYAADCEINQYIENLPVGCIRRHELEKEFDIQLNSFAGTKYYYKELINVLPENPSMPSGCGSHDSWKEFDKLSDAEKKLISNQIESSMKSSAEQVIKSRGTIPGELKSSIAKLFEVREEVFNWKAYFRRLMGSSFKIFIKKSKRKLSKRFSGMAGLKIRKKHHILVGVDTSGSVSNSELVEFFSEITHIHKSGANVTVVECDTRINKIYSFTGKFTGEIHGRGGTDFDPVIQYYNDNCDKFTTLVYFTDGECYINKLPKKNMVWVISSNGGQVENFPGYIIKIPKNNK